MGELGDLDEERSGRPAFAAYDGGAAGAGWDDVDDDGDDGDEGEGGVGAPFGFGPDGDGEADANPFGLEAGAGDADALDLEQLFEELAYSEPGSAEEELRSVLRRGEREAPEAEVLGALLRVFQVVRNAALDDGDWSTAMAFCDHLTAFCDRNFTAALGGEGDARGDFPPSAVAAVYAECGRTLALAGELPRARDRLEKALNVFGVVQDDRDAARQRQVAATRASFARVLWRLGHEEPASKHYLQALTLYATLPPGTDIAEFVTEYCEHLGRVGGESISPVTLALLTELAEEKFGVGSDEHLEILKALGEACEAGGRLELAGPALLRRAELLRAAAGPTLSLGRAAAAADVAEDAAARALEAAVAKLLDIGDLAAAAQAWEGALQLRESLEGEDSETCTEMRSSLTALRAAAAAQVEAAAAAAA